MNSQMMNMIILSMGTHIAMQTTSIIDKIFTHGCNLIMFIYAMIVKRCQGPVNTLTIERVYDKSAEDTNNKILIDALLDGCEHGRQFKVDNKSSKQKYENEYEREKARTIYVKKNECFTESEITVSTKVTTKKGAMNSANRDAHTIGSNSQKTKDENVEIEIPDKEIMTLTSTKSIKEIVEFIKEKKEKYISKMCRDDLSLCVFNTVFYGSHYNEFLKVPFGSKKVFDAWFLPEKKIFLNLINDFENNIGAYAISGVQKKLIILLHGKPGCGKSSFIKALANRLNRHLFPVALDKFNNIVPFNKFFYNAHVFNDETQCFDYIPFNKRMVVLEEIDTAGAIVMDRDKLYKAQEENDVQLLNKFSFFDDMVKKKSLHQKASKKKKLLHEKHKIDMRTKFSEERVTLEKNLKVQLDKKEISEDLMKSNLSLFDEKVRMEFAVMDEEADEKCDKIESDAFNNVTKPKNGIHLGDLLNVFDGITELKDFVCVITTNHKQFLDPALIRPGRITYEIELANMRAPEIKEMLTYYFIQHNCKGENQPLDDKLNMIHHIATCWDGQFAPSKIETACLHNTLQSLYQNLQ